MLATLACPTYRAVSAQPRCTPTIEACSLNSAPLSASTSGIMPSPTARSAQVGRPSRSAELQAPQLIVITSAVPATAANGRT